jgi:ATP-dependent helicase/nuclease subunit A
VVNLARGTGARRQPIRVAVDPSGESASVAVGDFQSEADEDERAREREETKRLLYVAMTRARDRLYLGSALKEGRMQPGRGSLAEVLPSSLLDLFPGAVAGSGTLSWRASSGTTHAFAVPMNPDPPVPAGHTASTASPLDVDITPLVDQGSARRGTAAPGRSFSNSARLVGTLTHRLLERFGFGGGVAVDADLARGLLRPDELDEGDTIDIALSAYRALCERPDLKALYEGGDRLHEVPFTMFVDGSFVRGSIDCLVRTAADSLTLLEFKTGRARDDHRAQLDVYRRAAERLFPGCRIDARLVYAEAAVPS